MISFLFLILVNIAAFERPVQVCSSGEIRSEKQVAKSKLIVFSGSDWCKNCILFKKKVLSNADFQNFAKDNLEIITADFPQRITLSKEQISKNEALAEKYNPKGEFPRLVLLAANEKSYKVIPYSNQGPVEFIGIMKSLLPQQ